MTFLGLKMIICGHFSRFLASFKFSFSSLQHPKHYIKSVFISFPLLLIFITNPGQVNLINIIKARLIQHKKKWQSDRADSKNKTIIHSTVKCILIIIILFVNFGQ